MLVQWNKVSHSSTSSVQAHYILLKFLFGAMGTCSGESYRVCMYNKLRIYNKLELYHGFLTGMAIVAPYNITRITGAPHGVHGICTLWRLPHTVWYKLIYTVWINTYRFWRLKKGDTKFHTLYIQLCTSNNFRNQKLILESYQVSTLNAQRYLHFSLLSVTCKWRLLPSIAVIY